MRRIWPGLVLAALLVPARRGDTCSFAAPEALVLDPGEPTSAS